MKKILFVVGCVVMLAAGCDPFGGRAAVGIVKTANGGVDWQSANKIKDSTQSLLQLSISRLQFDPSNTFLYAGTYDGGLYKSEDAAENWQEVLGQIPVFDFAFSPTDSNTMYAAGYVDNRGRVLKTLDGGKSWNDIYSDAGAENPVRAVAVNPSNADQIVAGLGKGSLIISDNGGATWRLLQNYNNRVNQIVWRSGGLFVVVKSTGVFRSLDNGGSFTQVTNSLNSSGNAIGFSFFGSNISDYRQISVSADSQTIYLTTNIGLYRSTNGGTGWTYVSMPYRKEDAAPYGVTMAPGNESIVYASAGSVIYKSTDGGYAWSTSDTSTGGLITSILVSPNLPQVAFAGVSK